MRNATTIVRTAIQNTAMTHFDSLCAIRAGRSAVRQGSYFPHFTPDGLAKLISEDLVWEPYTHSLIGPPISAFIARSFPGRLGQVHIDDIPSLAGLSLVDPIRVKGGDNSDQVIAVWENQRHRGHRVDFTVALIGPGLKGPQELVTFFPGDPIEPTTIKRFIDCVKCSRCNGTGREMDGERGRCLKCDNNPREDLHNTKLPAYQAKARGIEWVKLGGQQSD